jgi:hypothetical protein
MAYRIHIYDDSPDFLRDILANIVVRQANLQ